MRISGDTHDAADAVLSGMPIVGARRRALKPLIENTYEWLKRNKLQPSYLSNCLIAITHVALGTKKPPREWNHDQWRAALDFRTMRSARQWLAALAFRKYGVNLAIHFHDVDIRNHNSHQLAIKYFGKPRVEAVCSRVLCTLGEIGYKLNKHNSESLRGSICEIMTLAGECSLKALTAERIYNLRRHGLKHSRAKHGHALSVALHQLGILNEPLYLSAGGGPEVRSYRARDTVPKVWHDWVERWRNTTTREESTIKTRYSALMTVGRWIKAKHPEMASPINWTAEIAAEFTRDMHDMTVGQYMDRIPQNVKPFLGQPMAPKSKEFRISVLRCFFRDLQDWGWITLPFNPDRVLRCSFLIRKQIRPKPLPIDNHIWAKLIWAGLNLTPEAFYSSGSRGGMYRYPFEYIRAVAMIWLFSGLRRNEIRRLPVDCVRREAASTSVSLLDNSIESTPEVCYLQVPLGKRRSTFEKPVDSVVADAIEQWLEIRPHQAPSIDSKTKTKVHYLLTHRAKQIGEGFINERLIPRLCIIAGVPRSDSIGKITSHRARHTMATLLANGKTPMTLYQLAEWLGHDSIQSSLQYVNTPLVELTSAFKKADYFRTNIKTIEVLLDRAVIAQGTKNSKRPYKYYNLGPVGYCANEFWAQCEHRMACIRCPFHVPRDDARLALLEAKGDLSRMLEEVALTNAEQLELSNDIDHVDAVLQEWKVTDAETEQRTKKVRQSRKKA